MTIRTWDAPDVDPARWLRGATSSGDPLFPAVRAVLAELEQRRAAGRAPVLGEVADEREQQDKKWGEQNHPDGTGGTDAAWLAGVLRKYCDDTHRADVGTWASILAEEVGEAFAESDPTALRTELIQVAAVAASWVEAIDRRVSR
jgi:hypothetical protein